MSHRSSIANALMTTSSFDRDSTTQVTIAGQTTQYSNQQPYNTFRVQTQGGNIVQGAVNRIRVSEVFFPYQIPTVVTGYNNQMTIQYYRMINNTVPAPATITIFDPPLVVTLPTRYFTATELAAAIQSSITVYEAGNSITAGTFTVTVLPGSNAICFQNTTTFAAGFGGVNFFAGIQPFIPNDRLAGSVLQAPYLAWTTGHRQIFATYPGAPVSGNQGTTPGPIVVPLLGGVYAPFLVPGGWDNSGGAGGPQWPIVAPGYSPNAMVGSTYNGKYTDYIDICSPSLCQAQYVRDANTNQATVRRDQICRLYVSNDTSSYTADTEGTRPFVISRQFVNYKVMKWTAERSIDAIDILLFDQYGQPLPIPFLSATSPVSAPQYILNNGPGDFAITFLVEEQEDELVSNETNLGYRMR